MLNSDVLKKKDFLCYQNHTMSYFHTTGTQLTPRQFFEASDKINADRPSLQYIRCLQFISNSSAILLYCKPINNDKKSDQIKL